MNQFYFTALQHFIVEKRHRGFIKPAKQSNAASTKSTADGVEDDDAENAVDAADADDDVDDGEADADSI